MPKAADESPKSLQQLHRALGAVKSAEDLRRLLAAFKTFVQNVDDAELEAHSEQFSIVFQLFARLLMDNGAALYGIRIMEDAVIKLAKGIPGVITNLHAWLFALCLSAKRLDPARPFIDVDVGNFFLSAPSSYPLDPKNVLLFFYLGGLIKLAVLDYAGAAEMFEQCCCMPAHTVPGIMVEALRKLMLVNAILGRPQKLPPYRSPGIQRVANQHCRPYVSLVVQFADLVGHRHLAGKTSAFTRMQNSLLKFEPTLRRDKNWGLAAKFYAEAARGAIAKLPQIFTRLSFEQLLKYFNAGENQLDALRWLEKCFQRSDGYAAHKIDMRTSTVEFARREPNDAELQSEADRLQSESVDVSEMLHLCGQLMDLHPVLLDRKNRLEATAASTASTSAAIFSQADHHYGPMDVDFEVLE
ncbi:COP9 signalosome complex subunit 3 [Aphelenchoides fujianensis]|nr:COP9 signalosome complex subunit 3 [Aphelenchoides fujianensis]